MSKFELVSFDSLIACSQEQCEAFVAEVERVALGLGATEEQHRFDSVWRPILRGCLQFDPANRSLACAAFSPTHREL